MPEFAKQSYLEGKTYQGLLLNVLNAALNRELSSVDREGQGYAFFRAAEEPGEEGASWASVPSPQGQSCAA